MRCESYEGHLPAARRSTRALWGAVALVLALGAGACGSTVTEEDLQKWTNNDIGLARIKEVVADPTQPIETRVRALEVVVEKGFPLRVRGFVDGVHDAGAAAELVKRLTAQLLLHVEKKTQFQLDAKDCLMSLERYMEPAAFEPVQKAVALWAFGDLSWDSPASEVQDKVQKRISSGQIMDLGRHGWDLAGILIENGFVVDKMVRFLGTAKDPKATGILLKGLRKLHAKSGAQTYHIEALRSTDNAAACAYLLEMYMNPEIEDEFRAVAFNVAVEMAALPAIKADPSVVVEQLLKLIATDQPEDRWLGATNLVQLGGATHLDAILAALKDDKVYKKAEEDPAKSVMDLCLDLHDLGLGDTVASTFLAALERDNRIVRSVAVVCLKAMGRSEARSALEKLAALAVAKDPKKPAEGDIDLDDFLGEQLTLGKLAQNALDGLTQIAALEADAKAGKYTEEQKKTRRLLTVFELAKVGEEYTKLVSERYDAWVAEQKELEKKKTEGAPAEAPPAGGAAPAPAGTPSPEGAAPAGTPSPEGAAPAGTPSPEGAAPAAPAPAGAAPAANP